MTLRIAPALPRPLPIQAAARPVSTASRNTTPAPTAAAFAKTLSELTRDLRFNYYGTEGRDRWTAFTARFDGSPLTAVAFARAMKLPRGPEGEVMQLSVKEFFDAHTGKGPEPVVLSPAAQAAHAALHKALRMNLKDVRIFMVGADSVAEGKVYLVGRAKDGNLAGISATRIYT